MKFLIALIKFLQEIYLVKTNMQKILLTGCAGFIGAATAKKLLQQGYYVIGIDNLNNYYSVQLKKDRLKQFNDLNNFLFFKKDISKKKEIEEIFELYKPDYVINLAAQAGVRYSIENPKEYVKSNIEGFLNILECSRIFNIKHLVYASSSSVYGSSLNTPYSVENNVDHPVSFYAATKKSNELMAHTYSSLYKLPTTGLRFFTVYGPWGRPDMALFKFTKSIIKDDPIQVYNYGKHKRDFTYIDDIVEGLARIIKKPAKSNKNWNFKSPSPSSSFAPWKIYNIGNNHPITLLDFISTIENVLGKKSIKEFLPLQKGDVLETYADIDILIKDFDYKPKVTIEKGIKLFVEWYLEYYSIKL